MRFYCKFCNEVFHSEKQSGIKKMCLNCYKNKEKRRISKMIQTKIKNKILILELKLKFLNSSIGNEDSMGVVSNGENKKGEKQTS